MAQNTAFESNSEKFLSHKKFYNGDFVIGLHIVFGLELLKTCFCTKIVATFVFTFLGFFVQLSGHFGGL